MSILSFNRFLLVACAGCCVVSVWACRRTSNENAPAPGSPRQDFGVGGRATLTFPGADEFRDAVLDSQGHVVLLGLHSTGGTPPVAAILARFDVASGTLDATFGSGGIVTFSDGDDFVPAALVIDRFGRFVISGGGNTFRIIRLDPSGALDATFGSAGTVHFAKSTDFKILEPIRILPNDQLVAAGRIGANSSAAKSVLARFTSDGLFDTTLGTGGMVELSGYFQSMQADASGRLLVGDLFSHRLLRRLPDGSPDLSFGSSGQTALLPVGAEEMVLRYNEIFIGGEDDGFAFAAEKLTADGTIDASFGASGVAVFPGCASGVGGLAIDDDARILISGYCYGVGTPNDLARFRPDGTVDTSFGVDGGIPTPCIHADANPGKVLVAPDRTVLYAVACATNGEADLAVFGYNP